MLSRVSTLIEEKGVEKCGSEQTLARIFAAQAGLRIAENLTNIERASDSQIEGLAGEILAAERYPWDVI